MHETKLNITAHTGPTSLAASALSDVKAHARIDSTYEDDLLEEYIAAAIEMIESFCRLTIQETVWELHLSSFPTAYRYLELPRGPVSSVEFLKYYDLDGVHIEWSSADYYLALGEIPARIYLHGDDNWEETQERPDAVAIRYTSGYNTWNDVPNRVKQPIYFLSSHYHRHREAVADKSVSELPFTLRASLMSIRQDFYTG